jgi:trehalose 6-phosphate phosphatase
MMAHDPRPLLPPGSRRWALFLDVDGTLLEIAETPPDVSVPKSVLALLERLAQELDGALALVSGRSLDALDLLFRPLVLAAAGQHGFERRGVDGAIVRADRGGDALARARMRLAGAEQAIPGVLVEDKGATVAVHYRRVPDREMVVADRVDDAVKGLDDHLELVPGKKVLEIRPRGAGKDKVIEAFLKEAPFHGRIPVFVGDDRTDEDGFMAVNRWGGHSIRVGDDGPSAAVHRLADCAAVREWLELVTVQIAAEERGREDDRDSAEGSG